MAKYSTKNKVTEKSKDEAIKIAKATQKPGQTKEQTKLIAQGVQKGIEQYKKQYKAKSRELDKKLNKISAKESLSETVTNNELELDEVKQHKLPWILLILSWFGFVIYIVMNK
jgi:hypothetical protein